MGGGQRRRLALGGDRGREGAAGPGGGVRVGVGGRRVGLQLSGAARWPPRYRGKTVCVSGPLLFFEIAFSLFPPEWWVVLHSSVNRQGESE